MKTIECLAVVFASCTLISVFYWQVVNFVVLRQLRYQLFALRDQARRIAIDRGLGASESFRYLEGFICKTIAISPSISLTSFLVFVNLYAKKIMADGTAKVVSEKFEDEAPNEFLSIREATAKFSLVIMSFNAPWTLIFAGLGAGLMLAFGKITRAGLYRNAEKFVEAAPEDVGCLQGT